MASTNKNSLSSQLVAITQNRDPFGVLSDLEITLILGFLSVREKITIRSVSTLWKACVDFRLSKAAIGHHFPGTAEAVATYSGWEEEASAFRKLAHIYGSAAKPSIARKFDIETAVWCICDHHMVWVDETHINFQRLWNPEDPTRDNFPVLRKDLKLIRFEDKPRKFKYPKAKWIMGDDKSGAVVLCLGVPYAEKPAHPKWLLAVTATGRVLWHRKHVYNIRRTEFIYSKTEDSTISFGNGRLCFIDSGDHPSCHSQYVTNCVAHDQPHPSLTVISMSSGTLRRTAIPCSSNTTSYWRHGGNFRGKCLAAHPMLGICFAVMDREMYVFSTITGERIENYAIPPPPPDIVARGGCGVFYFHFGSSGQTWLLVEVTDVILGYEIELESFRIARQRTWDLTPNDNCPTKAPRGWKWGLGWSTKLDPVSGILHIVERQGGVERGPLPITSRQDWADHPSRIVVVKFEPTEETSDIYHIKSCEFLTLPPKKEEPTEEPGVKKSGLRQVLEEEKSEVKLPSGRREFVVPYEFSMYRLLWRAGPYIMLESGGWNYKVCVFGCVPRF